VRRLDWVSKAQRRACSTRTGHLNLHGSAVPRAIRQAVTCRHQRTAHYIAALEAQSVELEHIAGLNTCRHETVPADAFTDLM